MVGEQPQQGLYNARFRCSSASKLPEADKQDVENGGKIIMPSSALDNLTRLNVGYPLMFKLTNKQSYRHTHAGVLNFNAEEGRVYIPHWMMRNLLLDEGVFVQIESHSLPVATFSKFEPQNAEFLEITNPKAVLEKVLRNFACLSTDDVIPIHYNDRIYQIRVLEVKPGNAVNIIECDLDVAFTAPVDTKKLKRMASTFELPFASKEEIIPEPTGFYSFQGSGNRLDGKMKNLELTQEELLKKLPRQHGIPDYDYEPGFIKFWRIAPKVNNSESKAEEPEDLESFQGEGTSLRQAESKK